MNVGQFFFLALFLTFLIFVLPVILAEFAIIPPEISQGLLRVKDVLIVQILGYPQETAKFPDVIFSIILPFGISLVVILIFLDFMQKNIFPNVSPILFFFLGWFIALITTRIFGPIISGFYAGLGFYGTIAFGAVFIISVAVAFKLTGAGLKGLVITGVFGAIFSFLVLGASDYLGLTRVGFGNIFWLSIATAIFAAAITYMYQQQTKAIAPAIIHDIDNRLTQLRNAHDQLLQQLTNPNLTADQIANINAKLATLRTEMAVLEEEKRKLLIETV